MYTTNNFDEGLRIINDFVARYDELGLTPIEKAIIHGSLRYLTYKDIQKKYTILQYTVEYISQNLAPDLWNKLTELIEQSPLIKEKFRVRKNKVWYLVEQIVCAESNTDSASIVFPSQPMEGKILLNRYEIEEHLFDRDSGERYFWASDLCLGNKSCLVIQRCHQTRRIQQQFEREAEILSKLGQHPQIPQLLAYFKEGQCLYLVYEQISGQPLTELLTGSWSESAVMLLLGNLLKVLEFIQQSNVIHRNLNPDNIVKLGDRFILIDFATVKESAHRDRSGVSRSTFAQGMKEYMPPEQLTGFTTFASDIYAIGSIGIHALTGISPRRLRFNRQTGNLIWRDRVQKVEVSDCLAEIIDRATRYYFLERYQSATEMLENLNNLVK